MRDAHASAQSTRLHADCTIIEQIPGEFERLAAGHGLRPGARAAHIAGLPAGYAIDGAALLIELTAESEECSPAACLGLEYQPSAITGFLMKGTTAVR